MPAPSCFESRTCMRCLLHLSCMDNIRSLTLCQQEIVMLELTVYNNIIILPELLQYYSGEDPGVMDIYRICCHLHAELVPN